jgi:hypothetical protein
MGRELAQQYDRQVARMFVQAARSASALTGPCRPAAQTLDEKKVAEADRNGFFRPAHYYLLAQHALVAAVPTSCTIAVRYTGAGCIVPT